MPEPKKIRVGVLCSGTILPHWQAQVIRHLREVPGAELVVYGSPQLDQFFSRNSKGALYERIRKRFLEMLTPNSLVPVDLTEQLVQVPGVELVRTSTEQLDLSTLVSYSPDVVISLLPVEDELITTTRNIPVWCFSFEGGGLMPNAMPNLQQKMLRDGTMQVELSASNIGSITSQFPLRTDQDEPTLDLVLLGASWLPACMVAAMAEGRTDLVQIDPIRTGKRSEVQITILTLLWMMADLRFRQFGRKRDPKPMVPEWNIGILYQPISALLEEDPSMNVRWLPSPSEGNKRMEPFGYTAPDGQLNVLYRKNQRNSAFDEIAKLRPKSDSVLKRSRTMLTAAAGLQYPFVVERDNGTFALISYPAQDRIELFRVSISNDKLEHHKTLINKSLINPTSIKFQERWWLIGTDPDAPDSILLAYYADEFEGPYKEHQLNPLKFSDKSTRPAGTPFMHEGELWRPARDGSTPNTDHVTLNRVKRLSTTEFEEEVVRRIEGFPGTVYAKGIRTMCAMGDITLIDGLRGAGVEKKPHKEKGRSRSHGERKHKKE
ncbi:MAG TPA: hypothetical protein PLE78_12075 [Flavobacteriales bacterium]|nr:hypothetical protein [Flavobacteriales bacterium]HQW42002.1 hypothetical protein [Flavobacteriales bacterium]